MKCCSFKTSSYASLVIHLLLDKLLFMQFRSQCTFSVHLIDQNNVITNKSNHERERELYWLTHSQTTREEKSLSSFRHQTRHKERVQWVYASERQWTVCQGRDNLPPATGRVCMCTQTYSLRWLLCSIETHSELIQFQTNVVLAQISTENSIF